VTDFFIYTKIRPFGAMLICGDGQTDGRTNIYTDRQTDGWADRPDKDNKRFSRLANAPKNCFKLKEKI